ILTQQGIPLSQAITYQLVQAIGGVLGYTACSFWIDRYGRRPVLFLYYFVGAFFTCGLRCRAGLRRSSPPSWSAGSIPASTAPPGSMVSRFISSPAAPTPPGGW